MVCYVENNDNIMNRFINKIPKIHIIRRFKKRFLCWYYFGHMRAKVSGLITVGNHRNIHLGDDVFINPGCLIQGYVSISIGHRTVLSHRVMIFDANLKRGGGHTGHPVTIGQNVWIGAEQSYFLLFHRIQ